MSGKTNVITLLLTFIILFLSISLVTDKKLLSDQQKVCFHKLDSINEIDTIIKLESHNTYICDCLIGSYIDDFYFKPVNKDSLSLYSIRKPIVLFLFAAYCGPCMAEIPAINFLVRKYSTKIEFIGISLDNLTLLQTYQSKYDDRINIVPSPSALLSYDNWVLKYFAAGRKMLPIPTTYFISIKKEIVYISVGAEMYIHETSRYPMVFPTNFSEIPINRLTNSNVDRQNIESLEKGISKLLNLE